MDKESLIQCRSKTYKRKEEAKSSREGLRQFCRSDKTLCKPRGDILSKGDPLNKCSIRQKWLGLSITHYLAQSWDGVTSGGVWP